MISQHDRLILRDLASRVAEIAHLPIMAQRREMWKRHTLDVTKNCVVEMILKDTHTCENHPERFAR